MIWFTSDTHFGHENVLKFTDRPWETIQQMKSLLDAMDSADESVSSWKRSEKRLDGLRWQLRTSPEGSGREVRG
jgi:putative phosphoesterase/phosphohydrolase